MFDHNNILQKHKTTYTHIQNLLHRLPYHNINQQNKEVYEIISYTIVLLFVATIDVEEACMDIV